VFLGKVDSGKPVNPGFERAITCPSDQFVYFEHHRPRSYPRPFHVHPSIEINYLHDCDMIYSFSGTEVLLKRGTICVFWATQPHRAVSVNQNGYITNAYVSLSEFLSWQIPSDFINTLLCGGVLCSKSNVDADRIMAERWAKEVDNLSLEWQKLHVMEIQCRLNRLAIEGWDTLLAPSRIPPKKMLEGRAIVQSEEMLRFITLNYSEKISVSDVAASAGISSNYAMSIFQKILGTTIKEQITDIRIYHAKALLIGTDNKILSIAMECGFGSLSAFYESFKQKIGMPPAVFRTKIKPSESL